MKLLSDRSRASLPKKTPAYRRFAIHLSYPALLRSDVVAVLKLIAITLCCLLVGSVAWSSVMGDPGAALFVVFFSVPFGLPALLVITASWALYDPQRTSWRKRLALLAACALTGATLMLLLGPRDTGHLPWIHADLIGGFLGGAAGAFLVTKWKRSAT